MLNLRKYQGGLIGYALLGLLIGTVLGLASKGVTVGIPKSAVKVIAAFRSQAEPFHADKQQHP